MNLKTRPAQFLSTNNKGVHYSEKAPQLNLLYTQIISHKGEK